MLDGFEQNVPILGQIKAPDCMLIKATKKTSQVFFQDSNNEVGPWGIWKKVHLFFLEVDQSTGKLLLDETEVDGAGLE